jgi:hypothetical protein
MCSWSLRAGVLTTILLIKSTVAAGLTPPTTPILNGFFKGVGRVGKIDNHLHVLLACVQHNWLHAPRCGL